MKTDNYLTLCLEQAAKSPLQHRHGCIIVRGGKVIGQGFNDYRTGFNGGALKTGNLSKGVDGHALIELRSKNKYKRTKNECNPNSIASGQKDNTASTFVPFENMGGGNSVNTPLSMHSEMMAIHSALSASSTMACSTHDYEGRHSNPTLRRPAVPSLTRREQARAAPMTMAKCGVLKPVHLDPTRLNLTAPDWEQDGNVAPRARISAEKHRVKNRKNHHPEKDRSGQQKQQPQQSAHNRSTSASLSYHIGSDERPAIPTTQLVATVGRKEDTEDHSSTQPLLLPNGRTGQASRSITERMKNPRLHGADLYVARLGSKNATPKKKTLCCDADSITSADILLLPKVWTGSLHEELTNPFPKAPVDDVRRKDEAFDYQLVRESRPCYRCICYMNSVGIKRVFWTNDAGEWEGAKVRDLVDALDNMGLGAASDGSLSGVFVTKHEVLMLRRKMGNG